MRARRVLWAVLAVASVSALVFGTGGFGAATVDRGVSMVVSDHDRALVSIWDPGGPSPEPPSHAGEDPITPNDTRVKLLVIENRFRDQALDVRVTERPGSPVAVDGEYEDLAPGSIVPVSADVDCNGLHGRVDAPLTVEATAVDGGFESTIAYDASVVCPAPEPSSTPESSSE
ncbi:hypothetical protein [Salinigranum sp. GCM10025319]|uniref:hypothetical protein n=1 Tax=Salinigranum sp. GCM10025319 TaxID=3252687 RepID=UPI0036138850